MGRAENGEQREPRAPAISRASVDFMLRSATHGIEMIESWISQAHASLAVAKRARLFGIESWPCAPLAGGPLALVMYFKCKVSNTQGTNIDT